MGRSWCVFACGRNCSSFLGLSRLDLSISQMQRLLNVLQFFFFLFMDLVFFFFLQEENFFLPPSFLGVFFPSPYRFGAASYQK